jgi:hypothetical protein
MPDYVISALVQAPFVLVMAFLVQRFLAHLDRRDSEWRSFMERADETLADRLYRLTEAVEQLSELVINHDAVMRGALRTGRRTTPEGEACAGAAERAFERPAAK